MTRRLDPAEKLTPEQRSMRARVAAHEMHARHDPRETTRDGTAASPASRSYHEARVRDADPGLAAIADGPDTPDAERAREEIARRAKSSRSAYFARLAFRSSIARRKRAAGKAATVDEDDEPIEATS